MSIIYGHRGASAHAPENTLEAFALSMEMGAEGFELDVHMSKDGELVVIHDETVDRTTDGTGFVRNLTLQQLKELDASASMEGFKNCRIPTLREVFTLVQDTNHIVNVEIKTDECDYPGIEEKCLALAKQAGRQGGIMPTVLNAANEVAVSAFLKDKISFLGIGEYVGEVLSKYNNISKPTLADIINTDREIRQSFCLN